MLPGMGDPKAVRIAANSPAVNKSLAELNIRGLTGATVLCITRGDSRTAVETTEGGIPSGKVWLRVGDVLALAGSQESVAAARALLVPANPVWERRWTTPVEGG
jgi:CPA2 family monovalent cation:H+ antiporter-2